MRTPSTVDAVQHSQHSRQSNRAARGQRLLAGAVITVLVLGSVVAAHAIVHDRRGPVIGQDTTSVISANGQHANKKLGVRAKVIDGPLIPGVKRTLRVRLINHLPDQLFVTRVVVRAKKPTASGCKAAWVKEGFFKTGKKHHALKLKPRHKHILRLPIRLKNLPTVNQDACKGARFPLLVTATSRPSR